MTVYHSLLYHPILLVLLWQYVLLNPFSHFFLILFSDCHPNLFSFKFTSGFLSAFHLPCIFCRLIPFLPISFLLFFFLSEKFETWSFNMDYKLVNYSPLSLLKNVSVSSNRRRGTSSGMLQAVAEDGSHYY